MSTWRARKKRVEKRARELGETEGMGPEEAAEQAFEEVDEQTRQEMRNELKEEIRKELKDEKEEVAARIRLQESKWSMWMRSIVIFIFALIGPIILVGVGVPIVDATLIPTLLDIFKIWLGAAIGISTNLLQRREQAPVAAAPKK